MKAHIFLFTVLFTSLLYSQNFYEKISQNARVVLGVNGEEILKKVSLGQLDQSVLYDKLMQEYYNGGDISLINGLSDFGIDYGQQIYYVEESAQGEDQVSFSYLCYSIKDLEAFEETVKNKMVYEEFETKGDLNIIHYNYYNKLYWKGAYALLIVGDFIETYEDFNNYYDKTYENTYDYETVNPLDTITAEHLEKMSDQEWKAYLDQQEEEQSQKEEEELKRKEEEERQRNERVEMRERTVSNAILKRTEQFFSDELKSNGSNLKTTVDPAADAFVFYSGDLTLTDLLIGRRSRRYLPFREMSTLGGLFNGDIIANFYLNEETVDMEVDVKYSDELSGLYAKMFNSKLNKKFISYLSEDDLGYFTYSIDSKEFWNAYPQLLGQTMTKTEVGYKEEWTLLSDVISLIVDEDALSNVITGDAIFVLHGLSVKSVTYETYEYDEEYNYNTKEHTKEELVPDYSFLFGSKEADLIQKVFRLSVKNELLREVEGGYQSTTDDFLRNSDLFVAYKNEMVIFTSTHEKLKEFNSGGSENKLSSEKTKQIKKNACAMYLNTKDLFSNLSEFEYLSGRNQEIVSSMKQDMSTINAVMYFSNGVLNMDATSEVPTQYENGALYLLHLIDNTFKSVEKSN